MTGPGPQRCRGRIQLSDLSCTVQHFEVHVMQRWCRFEMIDVDRSDDGPDSVLSKIEKRIHLEV